MVSGKNEGSDFLSRRDFVKRTGLIATAGILAPSLGVVAKAGTGRGADSVVVSTDFVSGGGTVAIIQHSPVVVRFQPHNQNNGDWSQVWWHFMLDNFPVGEEITLQLDRGQPKGAGVTSQACFSYDQEVWGRTDRGATEIIDGREFFVYRHVVRSAKVWFAYDLPYTPSHIDSILMPVVKRDSNVKAFELCKSRGGRPVNALLFDSKGTAKRNKHGIWLQARAHAFESGASWVLHELAMWLMSGDETARSLREKASIYIVPIVDVDGVVEGRTGKNQNPYDHNRGWKEIPNHWPETRATQSILADLAKQNMVDMYIDFHGPGSTSHPYFIVADEKSLSSDKQRSNRARFFDILSAKPLDNASKIQQSMTHLYYSPRNMDMSNPSSAHWVTMNANDHTIAMTLEVNMSTPLSMRAGYQAEAITLGRAMANYFSSGAHKR